MARKYVQRNTEYWDSRRKSTKLTLNNAPTSYSAEELKQLVPKMVGGSEITANWYDPQAATRAYNREGIGGGWNGMGGTWNGPQFRFPNVYNGILPYQSVQSASWIGLPDAIELCQKAYANIAVVGNAIETQVEFSCSPIHLKCGNKSALKACKAWLKRIKIDDFQEQFYREFFRSANVFIYRVYGKLKQSLIDELNTKYGYKVNKTEIIVGYVILNPVNIVVRNAGVGLYQSYVKFLTSIELASLTNSEFGLEMLKQLGVTDEQLNKNYPEIYLEFDTSKLAAIFNRKQTYEPLAVPPLWSLMDDLEIKLKMKRCDESILITIEDVILLITHGAKQADGGMNPLNHAALTQMFSTKLTNRVLIADYTTKAEFVIPDFKKVLGKEKYEQVDKDIKDGLQTILIGGSGGEKFSNQMTQIKMFLKKLAGARRKFKEFLEGELETFCNAMGFRDIPVVELEEIDMEDEVQFQRIVQQLMQFGLLTPEHGFKVMQDGVFPSQEENVDSQKTYKQLRDEGLFSPLAPNMGGANAQSGRPPGTGGTPQSTKKKVPVLGENELKASEINNNIKNDEDLISVKGVAEVMKEINSLYSLASKKFREEQKKDISADDSIVKDVVLNVIYNSKIKNWKENVARVVDSRFDTLFDDWKIKKEIEDLSKKYSVDKYLAAIILNSRELGV